MKKAEVNETTFEASGFRKGRDAIKWHYCLLREWKYFAENSFITMKLDVHNSLYQTMPVGSSVNINIFIFPMIVPESCRGGLLTSLSTEFSRDQCNLSTESFRFRSLALLKALKMHFCRPFATLTDNNCKVGLLLKSVELCLQGT